MDTISLNIYMTAAELSNHPIDLSRLQKQINDIISPHGYTYCDFLGMKSSAHFQIKVSYPRFFRGINAYLVYTAQECLAVQRNLIEQLAQILYIFGYVIDRVELLRVDIPFTYYAANDFDFTRYQSVFTVLAHSYYLGRSKKKVQADTKGIIDMLSFKLETVNLSTHRSSGGNQEICIYNQYRNIETKTINPELWNQYLIQYPDLKRRVRIEVKKRIKRKKFTSLEFMNFNILLEYGEKHKQFLLKTLFSKKNLEEIKKLYYQKLQESYLQYQGSHTKMNYITWIYIARENIIDYGILRQVLKENINNPKTLESAITKIRKELIVLNEQNIVMNTFQIIEDMKKNIQHFTFVYDYVGTYEEIECVAQEVGDEEALSEEEVDDYIPEWMLEENVEMDD